MPSKLYMNNLSLCLTKTCLLTLLGISILCAIPPLAKAQFEITVDNTEEEQEKEEWERHISLSGIFEAKFPQDYKYKIFPFRFNKEKIAFSTELLSSLDGNKASENRSIIIRAVQTFGNPISLRKAKKLLKREAERYVRSAKKTGGTVIDNEDIDYHSFPGKNIYITFYEKGEKFGIRIRVYITDYSKVEQVLTGPAKAMFSYRSDDFFNTLKLNDGITTLDEPLEFAKGWKEYTANNNTFTVKLPPVNANYVPKPPQFAGSPKKEVMRTMFVDPVANEKVFYKVYSYNLNEKLNYKLAKKILFTQHVQKYVDNASIKNLNTKSTIKDKINIMSATLIITPPKNTPYISSLMLKMHYIGNIAVVQEITSSANHAANDFPSLLLNKTLKFHPRKFKGTSSPDTSKSKDARK